MAVPQSEGKRVCAAPWPVQHCGPEIMEWESEAPGVYSAEAEPVMAEEEPAMMAEEEPVMVEAEQASSSLAAAEREAPVFGEEVMVEATAEEPYGEVPEETSAVEGVVVVGVAAEEP